MAWELEYTDEFGGWWDSLNESEQDDIAATVGLLEEKGPSLPFPYSSGIEERPVSSDDSRDRDPERYRLARQASHDY